MRLHHLSEEAEPWANFEEAPGKLVDFREVRRTIDVLTEKRAGTKKNIVDVPIVLSVHSHTCPDLTLIDLPGITRIPLKDSEQPEDIEKITTDMARRYCEDERTIILCVVPANIDLSTSEALKYAQQWDVHQVRTVCVLTKLDIMDVGTNAKRVLLNQEINLKLGYVGVRNRSQQDILNSVGVQLGLEAEKQWFLNHPIYHSLPKDCYGTDTLTQKLSRIMYAHIRTALPKIAKEADEKLRQVDERLKDLGPPLPKTAGEKVQLLWGMVTDFVTALQARIAGKFDMKSLLIGRGNHFELTGGAKIKSAFFDLFSEFSSPELSVTAGMTDQDIERAILLHEGDNMPGFPSVETFYYLVRPEIEKLKDPAVKCLMDVYYYLEELAQEVLIKTFTRFPSVSSEIMALVQQIMSEERDKAKYIVEAIVDSEAGYMFTNDVEYNAKRTDVVVVVQPQGGKPTDAPQAFVKEMRLRIESYYKLVVRSVRDAVPKIIGTFLVRAVQSKLQLELATRLTARAEVGKFLEEPPWVTEERARLGETREVLRRAAKAMQRDPEYPRVL